MCVYTWLCVFAPGICVCLCVCACVCVCVRVCVCVCVCVRDYLCLNVILYVYEHRALYICTHVTAQMSHWTQNPRIYNTLQQTVMHCNTLGHVTLDPEP